MPGKTTKAEEKCAAKRKFRSAKKALLSIFFKSTTIPLAPYKCEVCKKWHVTKNKQQVEKWEKRWDIKLLMRRFPNGEEK